MDFECPKCKRALIAVTCRAGQAAVCGACGGIWLDNTASQTVVQNLLDEAVRFAARQADVLAEKKQRADYRSSRVPAPSRTCAQCAGPLSETTFEPAGIVLDICSAHGTWFDAGELWAMAEHFEIRAAADDAEATAFGAQMEAHRRADNDFRAAALVVGFIGRR